MYCALLAENAAVSGVITPASIFPVVDMSRSLMDSSTMSLITFGAVLGSIHSGLMRDAVSMFF